MVAALISKQLRRESFQLGIRIREVGLEQQRATECQTRMSADVTGNGRTCSESKNAMTDLMRYEEERRAPEPALRASLLPVLHADLAIPNPLAELNSACDICSRVSDLSNLKEPSDSLRDAKNKN